MALTFDLAAIPLKLVAFPVVVGLAAGTGALAAYVTTPASTPVAKETAAVIAALPATPTAAVPAAAADQITPAKAIKKPSCEQQTWPYIDNRCIARKGDKGGAAPRSVRLVMAPRDDDGSVASGKGPQLITSDGVLRGPRVAPEADAPKAKPVAPVVKKVMRRTDSRRPRSDEFRRVYSVYTVPSAGSSKPVIVVRPARVEQYSSRF
jgi:hypothetical protein